MTENSNVVPFVSAESDGQDQTKVQTPASSRLLEAKRMVEAIIFASAEPVHEKALAERLPEGVDLSAALEALRSDYEKRGVNLVRVENSWAFRTASDLSFLMNRNAVQQRKLSRAALEMLAVIAYHQPVTRAEIEDIRGVETSKGTLDILLETGWVKMRGRRRTPGRPVTYGTSTEFLDHFGLEELRDLPGVDELRGAGLLSARMPANFAVPQPMTDPDELTEDEDPLTDIDLEELGLLTPLAEDD
ncbi:SMC-Scp complex subunit ScpB [Nitratireductor sp. GISD-1A_MAKvit]|uniref:SMC-Scp complex subunit ScpB n=1 Tax=Nitratireductor sp. GISD-1A_MAKvit TaxID=3234198 RepID=UPI0034662BA7